MTRWVISGASVRSPRHQDQLTFASSYREQEHYVLPLSHDEVVREKRSLLGRMPGDEWQQFANLKVLLGYQWLFTGKPLLFMEGIWSAHGWNADGEIDWSSLESGNLPVCSSG